MSEQARQNKPENPYFEVQAELGITKHAGGLAATKKLISLCQLDREKLILDVGCGAGISTVNLVRRSECQVIGIDLRLRMIERAAERLQDRGLTDKVMLVQADAQKLPFRSSVFDAVLSESVTAFVTEKKTALSEYTRVVKQGGYIALNEITWLEPPDRGMEDYVSKALGGIMPLSAEGWEDLLTAASLRIVQATSQRLTLTDQFLNEMRAIGICDYFKAVIRFFSMFTKPYFRTAIREMLGQACSLPRRLTHYLGWGIYLGKRE